MLLNRAYKLLSDEASRKAYAAEACLKPPGRPCKLPLWPVSPAAGGMRG